LVTATKVISERFRWLRAHASTIRASTAVNRSARALEAAGGASAGRWGVTYANSIMCPVARPSEDAPPRQRDARQTLDIIHAFIKTCLLPAVVEPGEMPILLESDNYTLDLQYGRIQFHAWNEERSLARRLGDIASSSNGKLVVVTERFGARRGELTFVDLARKQSDQVFRQGARGVLRDLLGRFLARQFPGWRVAALSTGPDLEHTLSPVFARAYIQRGGHGWAVLASPKNSQDAQNALGIGLLWLDYLRRTQPSGVVVGLVLFLPAGMQAVACQRLRALDPEKARCAVYVYDEDGAEQPVEIDDFGNIDARLLPHASVTAATGRAGEWIRRLTRMPCVDAVSLGAGAISFRVNGLEVARLTGTRMMVGVERRKIAASLAEVEELAAQVAAIRQADSVEPRHAWRRRNPEAWLESMLRRDICAVDSSLLREPVYGQVSAMLGLDRGVVDLLAVDNSGRLAVIEVKATEDAQLPLQALDYWARIRYHAERGELAEAGYFRGVNLLRAAPRLLLVAPALQFHPSTETLLRFYSSDIAVERVGLGVEWQKNISVVLRLYGAEAPGWDNKDDS